MLFLVISYNRPKHLYICLDSIFRIKGDFDVFVSSDGGSGCEKELKSVISEFPVDGWLIRKHNLNNLLHLTYSVCAMFGLGYDKIAYIEDDLIVRPDTLQYIEDTSSNCYFTSLCGNSKEERIEYRPIGNVVTTFCELYEYVVTGEYIGKKRPMVDQILSANTTGHDAVYYRFVLDRQKYTLFPDKPYVGHFGISGRNSKPDPDGIEEYIFSGDKQRWLEQAVNALETMSHSNLLPKGFRYGF